jgi:hypothetical protein
MWQQNEAGGESCLWTTYISFILAFEQTDFASFDRMKLVGS